jgi:hypothetical protein
MTKQDIIDLNNGLISVSTLKGVKFSYAVAKNRSLIKDEIDAIEAASKPSEAYEEFTDKRIAICLDMCSRDEKNAPIIINNNYTSDDMEGMIAKVNKLQEGYVDAIKEREDQLIIVGDLLKEKSNIKLHKVSIDLVPEDITPGEMEAIFLMIKE